MRLIILLILCVTVCCEESTILDLDVKIKSACNMAEYDAIRLDMIKSQKPNFIISVHELVSDKVSSTKLFPKLEKLTRENENDILSLNKSILEKGENYQLPLPSSNGIFEVSICKDSKEEGNCNNKKSADISVLLNTHNLLKKMEFTDEDYIYFSQIFVLDKGKLTVAEKPLLNASLTKFTRQLKNDFKFNLTKELKVRLQTALSLPLIVNENKLVIELPTFNFEKCGYDNLDKKKKKK